MIVEKREVEKIREHKRRVELTRTHTYTSVLANVKSYTLLKNYISGSEDFYERERCCPMHQKIL